MYSASKLVDYPNKIPQFDGIFESFAAINNNTQSEDCLTLNVWSKPDPNQLKPVYVKFHGGSRFLLLLDIWLHVSDL